VSDVDADRVEPRGRQSSIPLEVSALTIILAITLAVMAGAGAAVYQRSKPTSYLSYAVLAIDQPIAVANDPGDATLAKLQRLRTYYTGYLNTEVLAGPIARQVHLTPGQIEGSVSTLSSPSNFLIDLFARAPNPTESDNIATAAAGELISFVSKQQAKIGIQAINRVVLTEVTSPAAGTKLHESSKKVLVSAGVAFVVVGAAFIIVADLLRRRW
jgi:hypothetical protein